MTQRSSICSLINWQTYQGILRNRNSRICLVFVAWSLSKLDYNILINLCSSQLTSIPQRRFLELLYNFF